jgi:hypothetical protein
MTPPEHADTKSGLIVCIITGRLALQRAENGANAHFLSRFGMRPRADTISRPMAWTSITKSRVRESPCS